MTSQRIGKVNMLPAVSEYNMGGMASVVGLTFDTPSSGSSTLEYNLMSTVTVTVNELQAGLFNYR